MLAFKEYKDFNYDLLLVVEDKEMYIYSKTNICHQPYWSLKISRKKLEQDNRR